MKHKNQAFEQLERTLLWNTSRNNTSQSLNLSLEISLLQEELDEFKEACQSFNEVDMFDALLDLKFVINGTLGKLGISPSMQVDGYEAVLLANELKSSTKNEAGKITKSADFIGPEEVLQKILNKRNINE